MSSLSMFLKKNKMKKENIKFPATRYLKDADGSSLLWEIKALTTKEDNAIREDCTKDVQIPGKPNLFRPKFDGNKYLAKTAARSVLYPDLNNKELQDSYGVMCAEDLIVEMLDDPGEYNTFMTKLQEFQGFTRTFQEEVDDAKN